MDVHSKNLFLLTSSLLWCWAQATVGLTREAVAQMSASAAAAASQAVKANGTAYGHPAYYYHPNGMGGEIERDPRQWLNGYGYASPGLGYGLGSGTGIGTEMLLTCLLVVLGIGVIGLPFILLIFSAFTGGQGGGLNFIPPTTTTTVAGRKKRELLNAVFPNVHLDTQEKLLGIMDNFYKSNDKMDYIKKLMDV